MHKYMHKIEWGGRCLMGITCYMVRPRALHVLALVNNGAPPQQMAIQSPQHK